MRLPFRAVVGPTGCTTRDGEGIWVGDVRLSGVRGFELTSRSGELPTVTVDFAVCETQTVAGEADVVLASGVAASLVALGWTPPAEPEVGD